MSDINDDDDAPIFPFILNHLRLVEVLTLSDSEMAQIKSDAKNVCKQGANFLASRHWRYWEWTQYYATGKDEKCAVNLYNCVLFAQSSLEDELYHNFHPQDIPTFAQTPVEVYQEYSTAFKTRIEQEFLDKEVKDRIIQYFDAAITQLLSLILSNSDSDSGGPIIYI
jgi:hypothetical protein